MAEANDWRETSGTDHNKRLVSLLSNGHVHPHDVTFIVGRNNEEVKGHSFILKLHSPVLEKWLGENKALNAVTIEDGSVEHFRQFLQFLYTGRMSAEPAEALHLLKYAVQFRVRDLEEWCCKSLEEMLVTENSAVTIYELAIKLQNDSLRDQALEFILSNAKTVLNSKDFLNFTAHNLFKVLASDHLAALNETQVFEAVLRWGKEQCKREGIHPTGNALRNILSDLLPLVRFPVMKKSDFSLLVAPLEILNDKELISVLLYYNVDKIQRNDVPPGTFNTRERKWFQKDRPGDTEYLVHRLEPLPNNWRCRRRLGVKIGSDLCKVESVHIEHITAPHQIKVKVDHPIWICSIGVNREAENTTTGDKDDVGLDIQRPTVLPQVTFQAQIIETETGKVLSSKNKAVRKVKTDTFHLHFSKYVRLEPEVWYTLRFDVVNGSYRPLWYQTELGDNGRNKTILIGETAINFQFDEVSEEALVGVTVTGLTQGFIPTIGFRLDSPKQ